MVNKRGVGNRAEIYFDSIDLEILEFLNIHNLKTHEGGYSVIDIIDKLKINNKSLKPHIDKLLNLGLIHTTYMNYAGNIKDNEDDKKYNKKIGLTTSSISFKFLNEIDCYVDVDDEKQYNEDKKNAEKVNLVIDILKDVRKMYNKEKSKELIDIDLRSKETFDKFSRMVKGSLDNSLDLLHKKMDSDTKKLIKKIHDKEFKGKNKKKVNAKK
jgi:hypothetical protein